MSEVIELNAECDVHTRGRTSKELKLLALEEWRKENSILQGNEELALKHWIQISKRPRNSQVVGTTKIQSYPEDRLVRDKIVTLKDVDNRLTLLEDRLVSLGERLTKIMEKIVIRIGKNESKIEDLDFRTMSYEASQ